MTFVPDDIESQIVAAGRENCPYCAAHPEIPCVVHRADERKHEDAREPLTCSACLRPYDVRFTHAERGGCKFAAAGLVEQRSGADA